MLMETVTSLTISVFIGIVIGCLLMSTIRIIQINYYQQEIKELHDRILELQNKKR